MEIISLEQPVEIDGRQISTISLRTPDEIDLAEVRRLNVGNYVRGLRLASRLSGLPPRTLEKIEQANRDAAQRIAAFIHSHI